MIIALALSLVAASDGSIQNDITRVRSAPRADAPVVARLRKATPVEMLEEKNGFVHVRIAEREHALFGGEALDGWVKKELVGAIDPKPGEPAAPTTNHVAVCNPGHDGLRTELLGAFNAKGEFTSLVAIVNAGATRSDANLESIVPLLANASWWPADHDALASTAFPSPKVKVVNGYDTAALLIDLGRCKVEGAIVSTLPLNSLTQSPAFNVEQTGKLVSTVAPGRRLIGADTWRVANLTTTVVRFEEEEAFGDGRYSMLCFADHDARPLPDSHSPICAGITFDARAKWFNVAGRRTAIFPNAYWTGYLGYNVVSVDGDDDIKAQEVTMHPGGPGC